MTSDWSLRPLLATVLILAGCADSQAHRIEIVEQFHGQGGGVPRPIDEFINDPWDSDLSHGYVIHSQEQLQNLISSSPDWPGENRPQQLERSKIDFSIFLLVVVVRSDMYKWPEITGILSKEDTIEVRYRLPPLGDSEMYARASNVCTYTAAKILRTPSTSTFVFTRTDTTSADSQ